MTPDPISSSTAAAIIGEIIGRVCPETNVRYWANVGLLACERMPSGIRIFSRAQVERFARSRAERAERPKASA